MFMRAHLVPEFAERVEKSWRWNDAEKASHVHNDDGTSWIFCAKYAVGTDELHWQKFRSFCDEQRWTHQLSMEYCNYCYRWNNQRLLHINGHLLDKSLSSPTIIVVFLSHKRRSFIDFKGWCFNYSNFFLLIKSFISFIFFPQIYRFYFPHFLLSILLQNSEIYWLFL